VTRPDDQIGLAGASDQAPLPGDAFKGPNRGRAHRDDPMSLRSRVCVRLGGLLRNFEPLGQDPMVGDLLGVDPGERPRAHVKEDLADRDPAITKPAEQAFREVQARGRGGDAPGLTGVDGLVAHAIEGRVCSIDVGRKGKSAEAFEQFEDIGLSLESHGAGAIRVDGDNAAALGLAELDHRPRLELAARADEGAEFLGVPGFGKQVQNLGPATALSSTEQARGKDAAAIHHQEVALPKQIGKGGEAVVLDRSAASVQGEEPRGVPVRERFLRDQLRRQVEVEILRLQKSFFWGRSASGRSRPKCL
jgi:hypothetical protein